MIALIGVVIGALATGGVTFGIRLVQSRREKRVACRLAAADVADALPALKDTQANMRAGRDWPLGGDEANAEDRMWPPGLGQGQLDGVVADLPPDPGHGSPRAAIR